VGSEIVKLLVEEVGVGMRGDGDRQFLPTGTSTAEKDKDLGSKAGL
jgi:hypothetical protein